MCASADASGGHAVSHGKNTFVVATLKISEQAETLGIALKDLLVRLGKSVPRFVDFVCEALTIDLT
jgi:hypothetical protein